MNMDNQLKKQKGTKLMRQLTLMLQLVLLLVLLPLSGSVLAQESPNVVLVFMDNFGWGELGVYGGGILRGAATPRIDDLASQTLPRLLRIRWVT